jgi:hypothetical protein
VSGNSITLCICCSVSRVDMAAMWAKSGCSAVIKAAFN